jgi:DNA repair protein RadA/Sms
LASSFRDRPVESGLAVAGEIGLTGELRPVPGVSKRALEVFKLGFSGFLVSAQSDLQDVGEKRVLLANTLADALDIAIRQ